MAYPDSHSIYIDFCCSRASVTNVIFMIMIMTMTMKRVIRSFLTYTVLLLLHSIRECNAMTSNDPDYTDMNLVADSATGETVAAVFYRLDNENSITLKMVHYGTAWLGLGVNPNGEMVGGEVVIGNPLDGSSMPFGPMTSESSSGVTIASVSSDLLSSSIEIQEGYTVLRMTTTLDSGFMAFNPYGETTLIWAIGGEGDSYPSYHSGGRGRFTIDITQMVVPDSTAGYYSQPQSDSNTTDTGSTSNYGGSTNSGSNSSYTGSTSTNGGTTSSYSGSSSSYSGSTTNQYQDEDEDDDHDDSKEDEQEDSHDSEKEYEEDSYDDEDEQEDSHDSEDSQGGSPNQLSGSLTSTGGGPITLEQGLTLEHQLVSVQGATDTNAVQFTLTYQGEAWLSIGINPDGEKMAGAQVVLAMPLDSLSSTNPGKYYMDGYGSQAVKAFPDSQQTLLDATVTMQNGVTVLTFTKLLDEANEYNINPNDTTSFVYAIGSSASYPSMHKTNTQGFTLNLAAATVAIETGTGRNGTKIFIAHGIMALIAWAVLAPMAAAASYLRAIFPAGPTWFKIHMSFNATNFLLTIALFLTAVTYKSPRFSDPHFVTGWVIMFGAIAQVSLGVFRPHVDKDAVPGWQNLLARLKLKSNRAYWELAHKTLGYTLLILTMWQMHTGLDLLHDNYGTEEYQTAFWIYMCIFYGLVSAVQVYMMIKAKKAKGETAHKDLEEPEHEYEPEQHDPPKEFKVGAPF